jgi:hypothetical protein
VIDVYETPRRVLSPTLLGALLVIGLAAGFASWYVATSLLTGSNPTGASGATTGPPTRTGGATGPTTHGPTSTGPTVTSSPAPPTSPTECPEVTRQAATAAGSPGGLVVVLYIKTSSGGGSGAGSEVWICQDSAHAFWYQGHRLPGPLTAATSSTSLFLGTVEQTGELEFTATNVTSKGTTRYFISPTELVIENNGATGTPEPALTAATPQPVAS